MKLYSYYRSSAAYRVRIALNIKKVPYDCKPVHLVRNGGEQYSAEYSDVNPQCLVPTLDVDGQIITQSSAIIEYLEERYSSPPLLPESLIDRARVRALVQIIACDIHPLNNLRVLQYIEGPLGHNEQVKIDWYFHWLARGFEAIETLLEEGCGGGYCFHDQVSMAEVFLIPQVYNAIRFNFDLISFPKINTVYQHCIELQAFRDAAPERQPDAE